MVDSAVPSGSRIIAATSSPYFATRSIGSPERLGSLPSIRQTSVYNSARYRASPLAGLPTVYGDYTLADHHKIYRHVSGGVLDTSRTISALQIGSPPPGLLGEHELDRKSRRRYRVVKRRVGDCSSCNVFFCGSCDSPNGCCAACNSDGRCDRGGRYLRSS